METLVTILEYWLIFVIIIFLHEFGHALTAIAVGLEVARINVGFIKLCHFKILGIKTNIGLLPVGGGALIAQAPNSQKYKDIMIGLAGPLVTLASGLIFMFLATPHGPFYPFSAESVFGIFFNSAHQVMHESSLLTTLKTVQILNAEIGIFKTFFVASAVFSFFTFAFNILPIPGLDGANILSSIFIWVFGEKAIYPLNLVNFAGFTAFVLLTIYFLLQEAWLIFR